MHVFTAHCSVCANSCFLHLFAENIMNNWSCFAKMREFYLKNTLIYNNLFQFLYIYLGFRYTKVSIDPNFAKLLGQNAQRKDTISDWDASSSLKSCYQIRISILCHHKSINIVPNRFISFECPLFKFY